MGAFLDATFAKMHALIANYWPLILLGFVALWLVLCFAISRLGWRSVAVRYPSRAWREGVSRTELKRRRGRREYDVPSVQFGSGGGYGTHMVVAVLGTEGIHLRARFPVRPFHEPLVLPWNCVRRVVKETEAWDGPWYRVELEVEAGEGKETRRSGEAERRRKLRVTLHLPGREDLGLGEVLARYVPGEGGSDLAPPR